ncbi:MAG TPA: Fic family protein [Fibrobacteria bacterium]|nr:Fic family protein [Fibrobacteria bacterium]
MKDLQQLSPSRFEAPSVLKKLATASRKLAELKGIAASIPNQSILINTLGMQEAKDSSAIENIVTTHDELYKDDAFPESNANPAAKEVLRYRQALRVGLERVRETGLLTLNHILHIQGELESNQAGFRKVPGTVLKDGAGRTVYTPPQDPQEVLALMTGLERFMNDAGAFDVDPLIKMALIHHQFESIHPFYDGNGRTGRILNVLYLVKESLLDIPILYLSRHIVRKKDDYYRLLQTVRDRDAWEEWVLYILTGVEATATEAIAAIEAIREALLDAKHRIRAQYKFYTQDLLNNLFTHPYTKIDFVMRDLKVSRLTATKYLDQLVRGGFLVRKKVGRTLYFINPPLNAILTGESMREPTP